MNEEKPRDIRHETLKALGTLAERCPQAYYAQATVLRQIYDNTGRIELPSYSQVRSQLQRLIGEGAIEEGLFIDGVASSKDNFNLTKRAKRGYRLPLKK